MTVEVSVLGDALQPHVELSESPPSEISDAEVVALPFSSDDDDLVLGPGAAALLDSHDVDLLGVLEHHGAKGEAGEVVEHLLLDGTGVRSVLLVGVGEAGPSDLRRAGAALARRVRGRERVATSVPALAHDAGLRAFAEGLVLGSFAFDLKTGDHTPPAREFVLAGLVRPDAHRNALERGLTAARAAWAARALAHVPSNVKSPAWLADRAREVAEQKGLAIKVWDEKALRSDGFGGILGVGQASANPPRMVRLTYTPESASRRTQHVVLVGKGITFDTGGLSLKPSDGMMNMKRDMTGAGVVLSVMSALGDLDCPVKVTGILCCAENSVDGNALRPGDVIRHYGGRTTEVSNTDAEGRLVLADGLAYAVDQLDPDVLVDVATLTGAMRISLGQRTGGMFASDDALAHHLVTAGQAAGEPVWRLPLVDDYADRLDSGIADSDNAGGQPGGITAALFLREFTGSLPWAHLDIAGVGDSPGDAYEWSSGPTGFGARLLLHWLELRRPLADVGAKGHR
jgi:leucyl aminopeptidase